MENQTYTTKLKRRIEAKRSDVYQALIEEASFTQWMVPDGMTSYVHAFESREGGYFRISLTYKDPGATGKSSKHTDTYHGQFNRLIPNEKVVQKMEFETQDPAMQGEMTVTFILSDTGEGTEIEAVHEGVPAGVRASDNETGWRMSLDKLAAMLEHPASAAD